MNEALLKALGKGAPSAPVILLMASKLDAMLSGLLEKRAQLGSHPGGLLRVRPLSPFRVRIPKRF